MISARSGITEHGRGPADPACTELRAGSARAHLPDVRTHRNTKRVSCLPPDEIDRRPDSVGRGMPNVEVYVVDDHGRRLESGIGELVIRGSNVMKGYWEMPEETDRVLKSGVLPGESALHFGRHLPHGRGGYLYFVARKDDIIKSRGEKVSPRDVENVLHRPRGIAQAAVVASPRSAPRTGSESGGDAERRRRALQPTSAGTAPVTSRTSWFPRWWSSASLPKPQRRGKSIGAISMLPRELSMASDAPRVSPLLALDAESGG